MKTHSIVVCILLAIGCRQCKANTAAQVDPYVYLPREGVDLSQLYLPGPGGTSALDAALKSPYPMDQQFLYPADYQPRPSPAQVLQQVAERVQECLRSVLYFVSRVAFLPISIIKIILFPVRFMFAIAKFGLRLLFLPFVLVWRMFNMLLYPFKFVLHKLLDPNPPPPYVVGVHKQVSYDGHPMYPS